MSAKARQHRRLFERAGDIFRLALVHAAIEDQVDARVAFAQGDEMRVLVNDVVPPKKAGEDAERQEQEEHEPSPRIGVAAHAGDDALVVLEVDTHGLAFGEADAPGAHEAYFAALVLRKVNA